MSDEVFSFRRVVAEECRAVLSEVLSASAAEDLSAEIAVRAANRVGIALGLSAPKPVRAPVVAMPCPGKRRGRPPKNASAPVVAAPVFAAVPEPEIKAEAKPEEPATL